MPNLADSLRQFSLADVVYAPAMERLGANLPVMRGFNLRHHPDYPHTAAWFGALDQRPAYQRVKSDDTTHNLVFRCAPTSALELSHGILWKSSRTVVTWMWSALHHAWVCQCFA